MNTVAPDHIALLAQADLVLYDGLVNPLLLAHTHARAERTICSSRGGTNGYA